MNARPSANSMFRARGRVAHHHHIIDVLLQTLSIQNFVVYTLVMVCECPCRHCDWHPMCDTCTVSPVRGCAVSIPAVEYELVYASSAPPASSAVVPRLTGRQPTTNTDTARAHWAAAAAANGLSSSTLCRLEQAFNSIASLLPSHLPSTHRWVLGYIPSIHSSHT